MTRKTYYIVKGIAGAFGATGRIERLTERFTRKRDAEHTAQRLRNERTGRDKALVIYFVESA